MDVIEEFNFLGNFKKKNWGPVEFFLEGAGKGGGVRVDVNEELKFL